MAALVTEKQKMLLEIYAAAGNATDLAALQKKADELFPDARLKLYSQPGTGRGFRDSEGEMRRDALCTIGCGPDCVAIFKNGNIEAY